MVKVNVFVCVFICYELNDSQYCFQYCRVNTNAIRLRAFLDNVYCFNTNQIRALAAFYGTISNKTSVSVFFVLLMKNICAPFETQCKNSHKSIACHIVMTTYTSVSNCEYDIENKRKNSEET